MAELGLGCCPQTFSSCGKQGLLSGCGLQAPRCGGLSFCRAQALGTRASAVAALGHSSCGEWTQMQALEHVGFSSCSWRRKSKAQESWCPGLGATQQVGSSQTKDRTHVLCIGRRILNHWVTREVRQPGFCCKTPMYLGSPLTASSEQSLSYLRGCPLGPESTATHQIKHNSQLCIFFFSVYRQTKEEKLKKI